jgi:NAD(P)H-hydrate epimerase
VEIMMPQVYGNLFTAELPAQLYTAEQTRQLDRVAIDEVGIAGFDLMSRAGAAAFELLQCLWPEARSILVFCGLGNNGGDGYILASLAKCRGYEVTIVQLGDPVRLQGDALLAFGQARSDGVTKIAFQPDLDLTADVIIDAMLGTGMTGAVRPDCALAIDWINTRRLPVLALDLPSGVDANTGVVLGHAVRAQATITFIGVKQGLLTFEGAEQTGALYFAGLELPEWIYSQVPARVCCVQPKQVAQSLPKRPRTLHKGDCGHVLVIGGDLGMGGAAIMAAQAAGRAGAGMVSLLTRQAHLGAVLARCPEIMARGVEEAQDIQQSLSRCDVVVAGPGIGRSRWGAFLLEQVLESDRALVLDADGLNYLSDLVEQSPERLSRGNWVLTPHPGEAARLLGCRSQDVQADRFRAIRQLQQLCQGTVVLKGNGSLVLGCGDCIRLIPTGNPGMASGGMGDVLSGVIGGLLAQGLGLDDAAAVGAYVHGAAADRAVQGVGERGLLATDLLPFIRSGVNGGWQAGGVE